MGLAFFLVKNINNEISTTEGFWGGKFRLNDTREMNNNDEEKRNLKIDGKVENKKRKFDYEEGIGK